MGRGEHARAGEELLVDGGGALAVGEGDRGVRGAVEGVREVAVLRQPVLRDVDQMSFADFERDLGELAGKAQDGKIGMDELTGGTFSITNGGIFGSMMSTPILNQPQSAILGMHAIQQRPMAVDGEVKVRPMMYLALTYDHRIIDGKDSVQFLVTIKEQLEDPSRLLLQI